MSSGISASLKRRPNTQRSIPDFLPAHGLKRFATQLKFDLLIEPIGVDELLVGKNREYKIQSGMRKPAWANFASLAALPPMIFSSVPAARARGMTNDFTESTATPPENGSHENSAPHRCETAPWKRNRENLPGRDADASASRFPSHNLLPLEFAQLFP